MQAHEPLLTRRMTEASASEKLVFAGVVFHIRAARSVLTSVRKLPGVSSDLAAAPLLLGFVDCTLRVALELAAPPGRLPRECGGSDNARAITWAWSQGVCRLRAPHCEIRMEHFRMEQWGAQVRAEATVLSGSVALAGVLSAIVSALTIARGGAVLHSASVEWKSGVVAFIGPSGAGKTTACQHVTGARLFSIDRLLVAPVVGGGLGAFSLPGGTLPCEPSMRLSTEQSRPLWAIYGLGQDRRVTRIESLSAAAQLALLRQCALDGRSGPAAAAQLLGNLVQLSNKVPVARLHLKWGDCLTSVLGVNGSGCRGNEKE